MFSTIESSFKLVTFDRTVFYTDEFMSVLESCARVEHILFIDIKLDYSDRHFTRLGVELPCLTFLELSFSNTQLRYWRNQADALIDSMSPMFRQCPNLQHFILDNGIPSLQAYCTREVLDHCPRIQTLSVTVRLRNNVTELVYDYIKRTGNTDGTVPSNVLLPTTTDGLRFFIHRPATDEHEYNIATVVFDESYSSLEHIELFYDGCNINTYGLFTLAYHGAPFLREIHFSLFGYDMTTHTGPPIDQVLIDLVSRCPSLEVIRIRLSGKSFTNTPNRNAELLMTIAKSCPLLRQLLFRVFAYRFDVKTMLDFAATVGPKLEYLFISMDHSAALTVVQTITTLVHFSATSYVGEIFNGFIGQDNPETISQDRKAIECILNNRIENSQTDTRIFSRYY
ncbi:hypothetical protein BJV82DRAFT_397058 [Fennellomyces sp. T-0311]|nr:hypothetical protein BJV82DRAFT_397058 [Fennellomyces sp. T-0311]